MTPIEMIPPDEALQRWSERMRHPVLPADPHEERANAACRRAVMAIDRLDWPTEFGLRRRLWGSRNWAPLQHEETPLL